MACPSGEERRINDMTEEEARTELLGANLVWWPAWVLVMLLAWMGGSLVLDEILWQHASGGKIAVQTFLVVMAGTLGAASLIIRGLWVWFKRRFLE